VQINAAGARAWEEAGRPIVPSLMVDGVATPILHVSQLAAALGLPATESGDGVRLAWETLPLLRAWLDRVRTLDLTAPTESRGRTLSNLTVNVFHPFELLPAAFTSGEFPWEPERDDERELAWEDVIAYSDNILAAWTDFVLGLGEGDPLISSPRGDVSWSTLLDTQRNHVAFHLAQLE
jgi:hypothetical protein